VLIHEGVNKLSGPAWLVTDPTKTVTYPSTNWADVDYKPNSITLAGSDIVRGWFDADSVMEFGFNSR